MYTVNPLRGTLANSDNPHEMQHNAAFHMGPHCLLIIKQTSGTEVQLNLEISTCEPLKYTMGNTKLTVSICMGKSIRIQRVENLPGKSTLTFGFGPRRFSPNVNGLFRFSGAICRF